MRLYVRVDQILLQNQREGSRAVTLSDFHYTIIVAKIIHNNSCIAIYMENEKKKKIGEPGVGWLEGLVCTQLFSGP